MTEKLTVKEVADAAKTMKIIQNASNEIETMHLLCMACEYSCKQQVTVNEMKVPIHCKKWDLSAINSGPKIVVDYSEEKTAEEKKEEIVDAMALSDERLKTLSNQDWNLFTFCKHLRKKLATTNTRLDSVERRFKFMTKSLSRILAVQKNLSDLVGKLTSTDDDKEVDKIMADLAIQEGETLLLNAEGNIPRKEDKPKEDLQKDNKNVDIKAVSIYSPDRYNSSTVNPRKGTRCVSCIYSGMRSGGRKHNTFTTWFCNNKGCSHFGNVVETEAEKCVWFSYTRTNDDDDDERDSYYTPRDMKQEKKIMGVDLNNSEEKECLG